MILRSVNRDLKRALRQPRMSEKYSKPLAHSFPSRLLLAARRTLSADLPERHISGALSYHTRSNQITEDH